MVYVFTGDKAIQFFHCVKSSGTESAVAAGARCAVNTDHNYIFAVDAWGNYNTNNTQLENTNVDGYECLGYIVAVSNEMVSDFAAITQDKINSGEIDLNVP